MANMQKSVQHRSRLLIILAIAALVVALLAIEKHTNWLELRPGSGTASAMALAAERPAAAR
ncbi:hypothetical protein [Sphingomonas dokdonensis]|uniref:Uncharacterized protein n=1 Tax=Sphingomonas dokdonensis TaxID=344880 RepID=A0A245ZFA0_9SPHN|nr:hypothetical protein [Sphingomonas dokdonensis]OWK28425.1 hypothetical protein SPDO_28270 [Sphingomonas dokdonensis]